MSDEGYVIPEGLEIQSYFGPMDNHNAHACITGPCGDTMEFWLKIDNGNIRYATFITDGCMPSIASGAAAARLAEGGSLESAKSIEQKTVLDALGGLPKDHEHCALLAATTLHAAIDDYKILQKIEDEMKETPKSDCETCAKSSCDAKAKRPDETPQDFAQRQMLNKRMCSIKNKILVLSGKGGVGKSTVAVNLATALMLEGMKVGLLDCDIHGPSIPKMLKLEDSQVKSSENFLLPVELGGLKVMSIGFFLNNAEDAVIWRGPMKYSAIKQFLGEVEWGELDYLIIDLPPGTGDEPLSLIQLIGDATGAVIVTTPQDVSTADVRRSISFCRQLKLPVLGVVENMSGFVCPHCGKTTDIFKTGGGQRMAEQMGVPFLGKIPIDAGIGEACDDGIPYVYQFSATATGKEFKKVMEPILKLKQKKTNE
jgi:ATP-binding protein involved in chromosome partitioning